MKTSVQHSRRIVVHALPSASGMAEAVTDEASSTANSSLSIMGLSCDVDNSNSSLLETL